MSVDFVIMDIGEKYRIPIILGRSFLATMGAIIDVDRWNLTFEAGEEKIEFILAKLLKNLSLRDSYCLVDLLSGCVEGNTLESP